MNRAYLAVSANGCIADAEGGVAWLEQFDGVELGFDAFISSIQTIVSGRTTYDQVRGFGVWPYAGKDVIVVSSRPLDDAPDGVRLYSGPLEDLRDVLPNKGDVWILGGGKLVSAMLNAKLVDRLELFVMPIILGGGVPLISDEVGELPLKLITCKTHPKEIVELVYDVAD